MELPRNDELTSKALWSSLGREQKLSIVATIAAGVFSIGAYIIWGITNPQYFYYSLISTTTLAVLADRLARFHSENTHMNELRSFNPQEPDLHYIGDSRAGMIWFSHNYSGLRTVYNTVHRPYGGKYGYIEDGYDPYVQAIRKAIDGQCGWHDLLFTWAPETKATVTRFYNDLTDKQKKHYTARELSGVSIPLFQITILKYLDTNKKSVVSFGFGFPGGDESRVFISSNEKTVRYFEDYFRALYEKGIPLFVTEMASSGALPEPAVPQLQAPQPAARPKFAERFRNLLRLSR